MKKQKLKSFQTHLTELKQNQEFAIGYDEEKKRVGLAIKIALQRQKLKLTQTELAKRSGITQQQLSKLERGENCNMKTFLKVCNSLSIEVILRSSTFLYK